MRTLALIPLLLGCGPGSPDGVPDGGPRDRIRLRRQADTGPIVVGWSLTTEAREALEPGRRSEHLGRTALVMEAMLYRRVVPVGPAGRPPAVQETPHGPTHELTLVPHPDGRLEASLCTEDGDCEIHFATGEPEAVGTAIATSVLDQLGMAVPVPDCLVGPPSSDEYATRITGRAAATLYGWMPPSERPGDPRVDPIPRAVFLDPTAASAQWVAGRSHASQGNLDEAAFHLHFAARNCPDIEGWAADETYTAALIGQDRGAFPDDERFVLARLDAGLKRQRSDTYTRALTAMARWPDDPRFVARAAAAAPEEAVEGHLAQWATLDRSDPLPVRRLARRALQARDWERLLSHCDELERRGVDTARWRTPALLALGRIDEARDGAPQAVRSAVAARAGGPATGSRPEELLLRAQQQLDGDPEEALRLCEDVLRVRPHWPEALDLAARAAKAAGRPDAPYRTRLRQAEP